MKKIKLKRIILISILSFFLLVFLGFYIYTLNYSRADSFVKELIDKNENIKIDGNLIIIEPIESKSIGLVFYPGGKVEAISYIPLLKKLSTYGITSYIVKMPFNLAVFNINAATKVIEENKKISKWYIGGHSLGGAMASSYVDKNFNKLDGLILLSAYPINNANIDTLTIYGSFDYVLDQSKLDNVENKYEIIGANHANFGNYGVQKGDGIATISSEVQQDIATKKIIEFVFK